MPFQRIAIIGTGLVGASLGLAFKRLRQAPLVVGYDVEPRQADRAARDKAIDRVARTLDEAVRNADLVVLAVPARAIKALLQDIPPLLQAGAIVTDTGSTKREILTWAEEYLPEQVAFVGGHPMAGRLTSGATDSPYIQFAQTIYCLTPSARTPAKAVERVVALVQAIGAVPYFLDPDEHDSLVAAVSHVPYVLASALMHSLASDPAWREMSIVAAGGFATATKLAEGDPTVYADICLTNRRHIVRQLQRLITELEETRQAIERGDETLAERFARARDERATWLARRGGSEEPSPLQSVDLGLQSLFLPRGIFGSREADKR